MEAGGTLQRLPEDPVSRRWSGRDFSGEGIQSAPSDRRTIHEFFWEQARPLLVKRNRTERPAASSGGQAEVILLGDARLPPNIKSALDLGPKFCHEPGLRPVEKLSLARWIGEKAKPEEKDRCVADGVDVLQRTSGISPRGFKFGHIIDHFLSHELKLLAADQEGGFVVAPLALYNARTRQAIDRNFMLVNPGALTKVRDRALDLCRTLELLTILKRLTKFPACPVKIEVSPAPSSYLTRSVHLAKARNTTLAIAAERPIIGKQARAATKENTPWIVYF
ncbi:hypothetical protein HPB47_027630 [Ixodes persulcatus]|uniref:Uncharacterized protein n=1 Tax=Ixodes persulcatus TaxID=34615 RepID=A0AC60PVC9_IXOPE|nr:hypothetical protein HPB47_027630 [Ixodes persulcatus]